MGGYILISAVVATYLCFVQGAEPDACLTPDAKQGKCINVFSCPHMVNLLKSPVPEHIITYARKSRCPGPDKYSVCCGPPPSFYVVPSTFATCASTVTLPEPSSGCCGKSIATNDRIYPGNITAIDQYPWSAIIEHVQGSRVKLLCEGALISGRYVLTAAHCVVGRVLKSGTPRNVRLGEFDLANDVKTKDCVNTLGGGLDCADEVVVIAIETITQHPEYIPDHHMRRHDIALLRLKKTAPYTDFIRPICLPQTDVTATSGTDIMMTVAGWLSTTSEQSKANEKLNFEIPYRSREQCQQAYNKPKRNVSLSAGHLCGGGVPGEHFCKFNSGPLVYYRDWTYELVGIHSFGATPCSAEDIPEVYTKVYKYKSWILSQVKA